MKNIYIFVIMLLGIVVIAYLAYRSQGLKRMFEAEIPKVLLSASGVKGDILTEADIKHLPEPVRKYLAYTGAIGKEKIKNFKVVFEGEFKTGPDKAWTRMKAEQYSRVEDITRLYYMNMKMAGLPIIGLHKYSDEKAIMLIKLAGLLTVGYGKGEEMNQGETVTVFNDMCMFAPASLIDERIQWESVDPLTVKATFNNNGIKVSALLYFNDKGELVNFVSDDRYYSPTGKTYQKIRWSTPAKEYRNYNGIRISSGGEAVWAFPEGDYCYARVDVKEICYNIEE
ncbi:MAG TPA: DUF6544 family protein [Clostridia bacterium]|nr:DUF6544 family protein [Clostridia bacterium]